MLSMFLFLIVATKPTGTADSVKVAFEKNKTFLQTSLIQQATQTTSSPKNIVEGIFDTEKDKNRHNHFIQSERIKNSEKEPTLKLQIQNGERKSWTKTKITKIEKEKGKIYFFLKVQRDNSAHYTGTYQLIFN